MEILQLDCGGGRCVLPASARIALDGSQYHYRNDSGRPQVVEVSGMSSNAGGWGAVLVSIPELQGSRQAAPAAGSLQEKAACGSFPDGPCPTNEDIAPGSLALGAVRNWYNHGIDQNVSAVLEALAPLPGGGAAYVWRDERVAMTREQAAYVAARFAESVYPIETSLLGRPWGDVNPRSWIYRIHPETKDVHILTSKAGGSEGMIHPRDRMLKTVFSNGIKHTANERQLILLSDTLFQTTNGLIWQDSGKAGSMLHTLSHEFSHLIFGFRKREIPQDPISSLVWENEFFAQTAAHVAVSSDYPGVGGDAKPLHPDFAGLPFHKLFMECAYQDWGVAGKNVSCYTQTIALGAFLLHQYGPNLLRDWLQSRHSGVYALDEAIRNNGGKDFLDAKTRFASTMLMASRFEAPAGYGFPAVEVKLASGDTNPAALSFSLPALDMRKAGKPWFWSWKQDGSMDIGQHIFTPYDERQTFQVPANGSLIIHKGAVPQPAAT
ncbi:hypothetical protein [Chromobacterium sp. IIBBL 290-4]|uniref:hypothetical protein n=1 Tax=Chromobacterium sp. IIBBL 290-4 TaxID=2953890 RepID=UPI0020B8A12C|nr:hypothetical protein [Chromobacterium sp. IIBBL 290-4]UTH73540.1 hypothetical protein NKT35_18665 [Chromobacterium sp. IIBBL 290-4]